MDGAAGVRGYIKGGGREADGWIRGRGLRTAQIEQGGVRAVAGEHGLCRHGTPSRWVRYEANGKRRTNSPFYRVIFWGRTITFVV